MRATQPVGAQVTLDSMMVDRVLPDRIVVREPFDWKQKLVVLASARVKKWQSVEVTGTVAVGQSSELCLAAARVFAYTDRRGDILFPVPKPLDSAWEWRWKRDVTADASLQSSYVLEDAEESQGEEIDPGATPIARIKRFPEGALVHVRNKWVCGLDTMRGCAWVEEADRSAAIKLNYPVWVNSLASFSGTMTTIDGQRVVQYGEYLGETSPPEGFVPPPPLGMTNRSVHDMRPDDLGRLTTVWGRVTDYEPYFWAVVNDGSNVATRIDFPQGTPSGEWLNQYWRATGCSDLGYDEYPFEEEWFRRIVTRNAEDAIEADQQTATGGTPYDSVSGQLIAGEALSVPVRVYTAYGSTTVAPEPGVWEYDEINEDWRADFTLQGVPGTTGQLGLVTAKGRGYTSSSVFAEPGSTGVEIELFDKTVRDLRLHDPEPSTLACQQYADVTAEMWDLEWGVLPGVDVVFDVTNGKFPDQTTHKTVTTDENGLATVSVTPTTGDTITVTASHLTLQKQVTIPVIKPAMQMWAQPRLDDPSGTAQVCVRLTLNGVHVVGATVTFTADLGGSVDPTTAVTNEDGIACTTFTAEGSGVRRVTASYTNACGWTITQSLSTQVVDIVFCVDISASMGYDPPHAPVPCIRDLLEDLAAAGVNVRGGAVMFDDYYDPFAFRSLGDFTTVSSFCTWLEENDDWGGGSEENQLGAMHKACADIAANTPADCRRFVVLFTDEKYEDGCQFDNGWPITREHIVSDLHATTDALGGTYLNIWENPVYTEYKDFYTAPPSLAVNGDLDPIHYPPDPPPPYPFDKLRARILQGTR